MNSQAIGRTTREPIFADELIWEDQLEPLHHPSPVEVAPGMCSVIIDVPARYTMVQVFDYVNVSFTLANDTPNKKFQSATTLLAKGVKVIARFGTTSTDSLPPPGEKRTYTLEVTPYRYKLIETAKSVGGVFDLPVVGHVCEDCPEPPNFNSQDPKTDEPVTVAELERVFGIVPPRTVPMRQIDIMVGVKKTNSIRYPVPGPSSLPPEKLVPSSFKPAGSLSTPPANSKDVSPTTDEGFRPADPEKGCAHCGKKK